MQSPFESFQGIGAKLAQKIESHLRGLGVPTANITKKSAGLLLKKYWYDDLPLATRVDLDLEPTNKIPREVVAQLENINARGIKWCIAGSYRRGKPVLKDVDIVICAGRRVDVWGDWVAEAHNAPGILIHEPYARGESKINTIIEVDGYRIRADIFIAKPAEWIYTVLYATGSGDFNIMMRAIAKRKGYLLNQKCLQRNGKCVASIRTERDIFRILDMDYVRPADR